MQTGQWPSQEELVLRCLPVSPGDHSTRVSVFAHLLNKGLTWTDEILI